jgi:predicted AlkP superfamily phosphohydrolase/phosphomutase
MTQHKLLVIGMDGAPFPLIKKWSEEGHLPNLAKLISRGSFGILKSTIPVHSPTAWSSFITGLNPGKHGVFDFVRREKNSYQLRVIRADQILGASIWRIMSESGRSVGVMNVPMTYPPEEVNGFLLSGLGTPDYSIYSYPPEMTEVLNKQGYRVNKKFFFTPDRQDEWLDDIHAITQKRGETAVKLMQENPWDFFMVVFRNSDEICHFYWHHMDETHPKHNPNAPERYKTAIRDLYKRIDHHIGEIITAAGENTNVIIMSDHGAGPLYKDVFLNEWLIQQGWLRLKDSQVNQREWLKFIHKLGLTRAKISDNLTRYNLHRLEVIIKKLLGDRIYILPRDDRPEFINAIDWSQTKAYSFGYYGQIFINLRGREPEGIVEPGQEYLNLRDKIAQQMQTIVDPGDNNPVVDQVYKKEELFNGDFLGDAPDLLAIMRGLTYITRKGYEFASKRGTIFREPYTAETGSHRIEGILIGAGPDLAKKELELKEYDIQDLAPTLLYLQQCPIPNYMDGHIISELITPRFKAQVPPQYSEREIDYKKEQSEYWSEENEAEITERLKKLGYLG